MLFQVFHLSLCNPPSKAATNQSPNHCQVATCHAVCQGLQHRMAKIKGRTGEFACGFFARFCAPFLRAFGARAPREKIGGNYLRQIAKDDPATLPSLRLLPPAKVGHIQKSKKLVDLGSRSDIAVHKVSPCPGVRGQMQGSVTVTCPLRPTINNAA